MADVVVENNEAVVDKKIAADEIDSAKDVAADEPVCATGVVATENGNTEAEVRADIDSTKVVAIENGDCEVTVPVNVDKQVDAQKVDVTTTTKESTTIENGVEESTNGDTNGDATDAAPAEAVKRKVLEEDAKSDSAEVTPEKKSKLEETSKDEVQIGAETSEIAA